VSFQQKTQSLLALSICNQLEDISSLRNDYFALRHGQSMANVAKIIASNPEIACTKYGLSEVGKDQAIKAGETAAEVFQNEKYSGVLILTSDLLRAKQTAETVAEAVQKASIPLYTDAVVIETRLRERAFGEWDGGSDEHYNDVWKDDATDPLHQLHGVESVVSVMDRATKCITQWDERIENYMVICVAHGDVLQILQTAFCKMDGSKHRTLENLETATLRRMPLASTK
jgi:probable phosphoglycerate mutase